MAVTNAKKLQKIQAAAANRQRVRRERMAERGRPDTAVCERAIVEALSCQIAMVMSEIRAHVDLEGDADAAELAIKRANDASVYVSTLTRMATGILVHRYGFDLAESTKAVHLRLKRRNEHGDPSYYPSYRPNKAMQAERIRSG